MRRSTSTSYARNLTMNDHTYALRRKVISVIYDTNRLLAENGLPRLPRLTVRIIETNAKVDGVGRLGANIIWIAEHCCNYSKLHFERVVLHEIIHTVLSMGHIKGCPLMRGDGCTRSDITFAEQRALFINYFKQTQV